MQGDPIFIFGAVGVRRSLKNGARGSKNQAGFYRGKGQKGVAEQNRVIPGTYVSRGRLCHGRGSQKPE